MVFTVSKRVCVRKTQIMLVLVFMWLFPLGAGAQALPTMTVCNDCSTDLQYSQAALWASDLLPGQSEDVYVVNVSSDQARAYQVTLTIIDPDFGDTTFDVNVTEINGDPVVLDDIAVATDIVENLNDATIQDLPAEDLQLPPGLGSAIDLIGPDSGSAGLNRLSLENALTLYFEDFWEGQTIALRDGIERVLSKFLQDSGINLNQYVTVVFEDGTRVGITVELMGQNMSDLTQIIIEFDTDETSVTAPGIVGFPQNPGQFPGFGASGLGNDLAQELRDLAFLFGIAVVGPDDVQECTSTFTCDVNRCAVTVSC